jgi:hypothetical protein
LAESPSKNASTLSQGEEVRVTLPTTAREPDFIEVLARGFVRCHCDGCGHEVLVAFSCKHTRRVPELRGAPHGRRGGAGRRPRRP